MLVFWMGCAEDPEVRYTRATEHGDATVLAEFCDLGRTEACAAAATAAPTDPRRASWDERACDAGVAASCTRRSEQPGDRFREQACRLGELRACLDAGDAARASGDRARAAEMYGVRCAAAPEDSACLLAARMADPAQPPETPEALWARCHEDDGLACLHLSEQVARGAPLPPEATSVEWLRNQACDLQIWYACAPHAW